MEPKVAELLKMKPMTSKSKLAVVVEDIASSGLYDKYIKHEVVTAIADNIVQTGDNMLKVNLVTSPVDVISSDVSSKCSKSLVQQL